MADSAIPRRVEKVPVPSVAVRHGCHRRTLANSSRGICWPKSRKADIITRLTTYGEHVVKSPPKLLPRVMVQA